MSDEHKHEHFHVSGYGPDGEVHGVRERVDGSLESGCLRPMREGVPSNGATLVAVATNEGSDKRNVYCMRELATTHAGPARVATKKWREHYDDIFGTHTTPFGAATPSRFRKHGGVAEFERDDDTDAELN